MNQTSQIAKHLRDVYFGGNWTAVNFKDTVADLSWQQATKKVYSFNTIAALVYHTDYFIKAVIRVLQNNPINASDKYSFDVPAIQSQEDWENLLKTTWEDVETFASLIEQFPDEKLDDIFVTEKYGNYRRNFLGIIEHTHYHLGQMVLIKKLSEPGFIGL